MKKILLITLVVIIAVIGIAFLNIGKIVTTAVNTYGSEITGTQVSLKGFNLSLTKGEAEINKLLVANPQGYNAPYIFELDNISVTLDIKSLTTDTIVINEINIKQPIISFEALSLQQNNLKALEENINKNLPQTQKTESIATEETSSTSSKTVLIKKFVLSKATVKAYMPNMDPISLELPEITLTDIDSGNPQKQIAQIFESIITATTQAVTNFTKEQLENLAQSSLNTITDSIKNKINVKGLF
ncbi:MAG: hypothetical protein R3Y43_00945 [Alphaproteobacteria bacterium]